MEWGWGVTATVASPGCPRAGRSSCIGTPFGMGTALPRTRLPREPELGVQVAVLGVLVDGQRLGQAKVGLQGGADNRVGRVCNNQNCSGRCQGAEAPHTKTRQPKAVAKPLQVVAAAAGA